MTSRRFWILWTLVFIGALIAAGNAVLFMTVDGFGGRDFTARFHAAPLLGWTHTMAGALAILIGPFQFIPKLRLGRPMLHRWTGRVYLVAVLSGALSGLYFAPSSPTGWVSTAGFSMLAVGWIVTGLAAWFAIRDGDIAAHRRWMLRNYALTFAAATLRIELGLFIVAGLSFATAFKTVSWLSWLLNLAVIEWVLRRRAPSRATAGTAAPAID